MVRIDLSRHKALLLDFDGTLADTEYLHFKSYQEVFDTIGIRYGSFDYHCAEYLGSGSLILIKELEKHGKENEYDVVELRNRKKEIFNKLLLTEKVEPVTGAVEFLEELEFRHVKTAMVSGGIRESILLVMRNAGIPNTFDFIVTEADFKKSKPDPAGYLMGAKKHSVEPHECLVFEDAPNGVLSARNADMDCIGLLTYVTKDKLISQHPTAKIVNDFRDIKLH